MSSFKFVQIDVVSKGFYKQRQITVILKIDANEVVLSDKAFWNNGKDWWYIAGYHVGGETFTLLFINTPKNMFSYGVSQYCKNSAYTMPFNVFEVLGWMLQNRKNWNEVKPQLFEKLTTEPIQGKRKYMHSKLKTWKDCIKTNFQSQDVPYDIYCNETEVLKIDSVYKQTK